MEYRQDDVFDNPKHQIQKCSKTISSNNSSCDNGMRENSIVLRSITNEGLLAKFTSI